MKADFFFAVGFTLTGLMVFFFVSVRLSFFILLVGTDFCLDVGMMAAKTTVTNAITIMGTDALFQNFLMASSGSAIVSEEGIGMEKSSLDLVVFSSCAKLTIASVGACSSSSFCIEGVVWKICSRGISGRLFFLVEVLNFKESNPGVLGWIGIDLIRGQQFTSQKFLFNLLKGVGATGFALDIEVNITALCVERLEESFPCGTALIEKGVLAQGNPVIFTPRFYGKISPIGIFTELVLELGEQEVAVEGAVLAAYGKNFLLGKIFFPYFPFR